MMTLAKAGKYNGYLLEGMACPGGCVAGAGTMQPIKSPRERSTFTLPRLDTQIPMRRNM